MGLSASTGWLRLELPVLASEVTMFMNYVPGIGEDPIIVVMDAAMNVLESYNLSVSAPISTPGGVNDGAYRGIARSEGDIKYIELRNAYVVANEVRFLEADSSSSAIPEPGTMALFGVGALGLLLLHRRRAQ